MATKTPPWKRKRPAGPRTKLTAAQKAEARKRAEAAGRRYPNLVDNMAVARAAKKA
jgi:hypothetical protein